MDRNTEYFRKVKQDFDLDTEIKTTVWTAQAMIEMGLITEDEAMAEFGITEAQYQTYKALPKS